MQPAFPRAKELWILGEVGWESSPQERREKIELEAQLHPPHLWGPSDATTLFLPVEPLFLGVSSELCSWSRGFSTHPGFSKVAPVLLLPNLPCVLPPVDTSRCDRDRLLWITLRFLPLARLLARINVETEHYVHVIHNTCWSCKVPWLVTHVTLTWTSWHFWG